VSARLKRTIWTTAAAAVLVAATFVGSAQAVQIHAAYPPEDHGSFVQGWAKISTDCPYLKCSVYLKIERKSLWPLGPSFVNGSFVNWSNDWVEMRATKLAGCYEYRTTIEIYEDSVAPVGGGANIGPMGMSVSGQRVYSYKIGPWSSAWVERCG
jgi:hypothetical protein